jgi:hypothetical protein
MGTSRHYDAHSQIIDCEGSGRITVTHPEPNKTASSVMSPQKRSRASPIEHRKRSACSRGGYVGFPPQKGRSEQVIQRLEAHELQTTP